MELILFVCNIFSILYVVILLREISENEREIKYLEEENKRLRRLSSIWP